MRHWLLGIKNKSIFCQLFLLQTIQLLQTSNKVQGLAVYSILKKRVDIQWLYSKMVNQQVIPPNCSLFGAKKGRRPLSLSCNLWWFRVMHRIDAVNSISNFFFEMQFNSIIFFRIDLNPKAMKLLPCQFISIIFW